MPTLRVIRVRSHRQARPNLDRPSSGHRGAAANDKSQRLIIGKSLSPVAQRIQISDSVRYGIIIGGSYRKQPDAFGCGAYQTAADIEDISRDLGFAPTTPISVGISVFITWYRREWMKRQEAVPRSACGAYQRRKRGRTSRPAIAESRTAAPCQSAMWTTSSVAQ